MLVIDGLKLLAVQLKDVHVCATMVREHDPCALRISHDGFASRCLTCHQVRNGIIQHVRACVDIWEKTRFVGSSGADDLSDAVLSACSDGPGDDFFDELCARVCDLLVVICHHACTPTSESTSLWYVACDDVRSARLRCKPSIERTDDVWVEPAACVTPTLNHVHKVAFANIAAFRLSDSVLQIR